MSEGRPTYLVSLVQAGFPSLGDDLEGSPIDTNSLLVKNPAATFFMRVVGSSMRDVGIYEGDIVVIDKSLEPKNNDIVVAVLNGAFTLKSLQKKNGSAPKLVPANDSFRTIDMTVGDELQIWGVITAVIRKLR